MKPIETAPLDGTAICVAHEKFGRHIMSWSTKRKRWEGKAFSIMRMVSTWWDEAEEQPTHWVPI